MKPSNMARVLRTSVSRDKQVVRTNEVTPENATSKGINHGGIVSTGLG
jgi:hypothetical protein